MKLTEVAFSINGSLFHSVQGYEYENVCVVVKKHKLEFTCRTRRFVYFHLYCLLE